MKFLPVQRLIVVGFSNNEKMDVIGYVKSRKNLAITLDTANSSTGEKDFGLQCVKNFNVEKQTFFKQWPLI